MVLSLLGQIDILVLGMFHDTAVLGSYGAVMRVATIVTFATTVVVTVLQPSMAAAWGRSDWPSLARVATDGGRTALLLSLGFAIVVVPLAPRLLAIFGPDFVSAAPALRILTLAFLFSSPFSMANAVLGMSGRQNLATRRDAGRERLGTAAQPGPRPSLRQHRRGCRHRGDVGDLQCHAVRSVAARAGPAGIADAGAGVAIGRCPVNLALVGVSLGPGGAERVLSLLASHWARCGHEVHLLLLQRPSTPAYFEVDANVRVHALDLLVEVAGPARGRSGECATHLRASAGIRPLRRPCRRRVPAGNKRACDPGCAVAHDPRDHLGARRCLGRAPALALVLAAAALLSPGDHRRLPDLQRS